MDAVTDPTNRAAARTMAAFEALDTSVGVVVGWLVENWPNELWPLLRVAGQQDGDHRLTFSVPCLSGDELVACARALCVDDGLVLRRKVGGSIEVRRTWGSVAVRAFATATKVDLAALDAAMSGPVLAEPTEAGS